MLPYFCYCNLFLVVCSPLTTRMTAACHGTAVVNYQFKRRKMLACFLSFLLFRNKGISFAKYITFKNFLVELVLEY